MNSTDVWFRLEHPNEDYFLQYLNLNESTSSTKGKRPVNLNNSNPNSDNSPNKSSSSISSSCSYISYNRHKEKMEKFRSNVKDYLNSIEDLNENLKDSMINKIDSIFLDSIQPTKSNRTSTPSLSTKSLNSNPTIQLHPLPKDYKSSAQQSPLRQSNLNKNQQSTPKTEIKKSNTPRSLSYWEKQLATPKREVKKEPPERISYKGLKASIKLESPNLNSKLKSKDEKKSLNQKSSSKDKILLDVAEKKSKFDRKLSSKEHKKPVLLGSENQRPSSLKFNRNSLNSTKSSSQSIDESPVKEENELVKSSEKQKSHSAAKNVDKKSSQSSSKKVCLKSDLKSDLKSSISNKTDSKSVEQSLVKKQESRSKQSNKEQKLPLDSEKVDRHSHQQSSSKKINLLHTDHESWSKKASSQSIEQSLLHESKTLIEQSLKEQSKSQSDVLKVVKKASQDLNSKSRNQDKQQSGQELSNLKKASPPSIQQPLIDLTVELDHALDKQVSDKQISDNQSRTTKVTEDARSKRAANEIIDEPTTKKLKDSHDPCTPPILKAINLTMTSKLI